MATARTETPTENKPAAAKTAAKKAAAEAVTPGSILAERYRDTGLESLVGRNGENVTAVMTAGEAMLAGMAEISQEMMAFAGDRLRQDLETAEDFAKANSPEDLFDKQCSFAQRAAQQYAEETSKLIRMMARIQQSCLSPMQHCTKAALQSMNGSGKDKSEE